jgi:tetratricopeptide (TPR) repeat protein
MRRLALGLVAGLLLVAGACSRSPHYYFDKANKLDAGGKTDEAALMYRKAIQADAGFGEAYYRMGSLLWRVHRTREAYAALLRAVDLLPGRDDVRIKLADLELSSYLADQRRPAALHDKIQDLCSQLLGADAGSYDGLRLKAHLAAADRNYKEAEELYNQANQAKPLQPEVVLGWTEVLFQDDKAKEAERQAFQLIEKEKTYGPIYDLLYKYYVAAKRLPDAENVLKTKMNNNPTISGYVLELAAFYAAAAREGEMQAVLRRMLDDPKTFPEARLQVGDLYGRLQRWDDALRQYEEGAKANSRERIAYLRKIADIWLSQGKGEQANQVVDEILKALPDDPSARGVKASLLLASGKPDSVEKAVIELKNLVGGDPENAVWHFNLGRGLAAKGDLDGARVQFQEAVNRRRSFLPPRLALLELSQARHDYKASVQYADEILAQYPNLVRIKLVHASSEMYLGKNEEARSEIAALEHAFPNDPEVEMQLAVMKLHEGRFQEAEEHFRKLAAQHQGDPRAMNGLVESLTAGNQPDRAIAVLQEELKKTPDSIPVRSILARTAALAGKYDLAVEQYQQLLALAPNSEATCLALGTVYRMKEDFANAITYFQKARALAPKDPAPMIRLGGALALTGRKPEALELYRDALKLKPDDAATWSNAAYLLAETGGSLDEAMKFARQAMQLDSRQPNYADTLGWVYFKMKLNDSAVQVFRGLTSRYPNEATFHYHFALALLQRGDKATARVELQTALAKKPSDEIRRNIETALAKAGKTG